MMGLSRGMSWMVAVLVLLGLGCHALSEQSSSEPVTIRIDVKDTAQEVRGFGAHIWAGDRYVEPVLKELSLRYVRMTVGPNWFDVEQEPPTDSTRDEMDRFLAGHFDGDGEPRLRNAQLAWQMTERLGIQVILLQFTSPENWLSDDGHRQLLPEYVDDYARYWGSFVGFLVDQGMKPAYIELANEPEGDWNTRILPEDYNRLVILTRKELDDRGYHDIGIIGPGLAYLDHDNGSRQWIGALSDEGVHSLAGWSTHVWDDVFSPDTSVGFIDQRWHDFDAAVRKKDPERQKPIIITEYATSATTFNGVSYDLVKSHGNNRASDSPAYAQRVYELTLVHINNGASVLMFWEAADQPWSHEAWGLATGTNNKQRRPAFYALSTLIPLIPESARALRKTWDDPHVSIAGLIDEHSLVLAFANGTDQPQHRTIELNNTSGLKLKSARRYHADRVTDVPLSTQGNTLQITLPAESTLTCEFVMD